MSDGLSGREVTQEGAQGLGKTGLLAFQFREEEMEVLVHLVLQSGDSLDKPLFQADQSLIVRGLIGLAGRREGLGGDLLAQEMGQGARIEAVGFGAPALRLRAKSRTWAGERRWRVKASDDKRLRRVSSRAE